MDKVSRNHSVRMSHELYARLKDTAIKSGVTVSETIRHALSNSNKKEMQIIKAKKILSDSKPSDIINIMFPGNKGYIENKMSLCLHKDAGDEMKSKGAIVNDVIMKFMLTSMSDGTLLSKGRDESLDPHIVSFRVNLFDVYCEVGPGQITILSVS